MPGGFGPPTTGPVKGPFQFRHRSVLEQRRLEADTLYPAAVRQEASLQDYWRLGESAGSTAFDSKGTNDGTYTGGFTLAQPGLLTGDPNTAVVLNGTTGYIALPSTVISLNGSALTFETWIATTDNTQNDQALYGGYLNSGAFPGWGVIYNLAGSRKIGYYSDQNAGGAWVESTTTITDTARHHIAVTVTAGGAVSFYIDGQPAGTGTSAAPGNHTGAKALGAAAGGASSRFKGTLDESALYNTVLSAATVLAHYQLGAPTAPGSLDLNASAGTAAAAGTITALTVALTADTGVATATGATVALTATMTAATGTATATGATAALAVALTAGSGAATAGGGTVQALQGVFVTAAAGTATAAGGTSVLAVTLTATTGTATATGGTASEARTLTAATGTATAAGSSSSLTVTLLAATGAATAAGGTATVGSAGALTASGGTATATGNASVLTAALTATTGLASAVGGTATESRMLAASGGAASATGTSSTLRWTVTAAIGQASAAGGTVNRTNIATGGLATATGSGVAPRFVYATAAGLAAGNGGTATISTIGFVTAVGVLEATSTSAFTTSSGVADFYEHDSTGQNTESTSGTLALTE